MKLFVSQVHQLYTIIIVVVDRDGWGSVFGGGVCGGGDLIGRSQ